MFPFGAPYPPHRPGPVRHVGYVLARTETSLAVVAYTSSGPWQGHSIPPGVIEFNEAAARGLGQRPFHLDLRCLARLPFTRSWFPDLEEGVLGVAGLRQRSRIQEVLDALLRRSPEVIQMRGPR